RCSLLRFTNLSADALRAIFSAPAGDECRLHAGPAARCDDETVRWGSNERNTCLLVVRGDAPRFDVGALDLGRAALRMLEAIALDVLARPAAVAHGLHVLAREHQCILRLPCRARRDPHLGAGGFKDSFGRGAQLVRILMGSKGREY